MPYISIVVPSYNEEQNVFPLIKRINKVMTDAKLSYEIIWVDDHSTDYTKNSVKVLSLKYPIRFFAKKGKKGKAFSLLEGFSHAKADTIVMIDADLQYPPEAIPQMYKKLSRVDIVVANRREKIKSFLRKFLSRGFMYIFAHKLNHMNVDVQSGLKIFKKDILSVINLNPTQWTFDMEFLVKARNAGFKIGSHKIDFTDRKYGKSNVKILSSIFEIGISAIKLRLNQEQVFPLQKEREAIEGFYQKGIKYVPYSDLNLRDSAFFRLTKKQQKLFLFVAALSLFLFILNWHTTLVLFIFILSLLYFTDILFNLFLVFKSTNQNEDIMKSPSLESAKNRKNWPAYTILCPLYKEFEVLPQFVKAIEKMDYPKEKMQVLLLLEENDLDTIMQAQKMDLPEYFKTIVVPDTIPKTKPKACNYGLKFATGSFIVIYDAEDVPEKTQLKKAIIAFENSPENVVCMQAKLNFYNTNQNILTKLFACEYTLWFDIVLVGLQSINAPIPLGGTSNHFKSNIIKLLNGWDSFNVTEDCDMGIRLSEYGFKTAILDSTTYEEANSSVSGWIKQRSRWIKGYIQTYLVHLRKLSNLNVVKNPISILVFQIIVGGKVLSLFINPFMWLVLISYFAFRVHVGSFIESFYSPAILYMATFSVIFGNFLYLYYYMVANARKRNYSLVPLTLIIPLYWLAMSVASWVALYEIIIKPYYWSKTKHGLHLPRISLQANPNIGIS